MGRLGQQTIPVPMTVGHEFVGEIVAVGTNVTDFTSAMLSAVKDMSFVVDAAIAWQGAGICAHTQPASE